MTKTQQFLEFFFGDKPDELYIYLWTHPDRKSACFQSLKEAEAYAIERRQNSDVYIGCAMVEEPFAENQRIKASDGRKPKSIPGLWLDIDFADPGHKKDNLPPNAKAARSLFYDKVPPSIIIHTGGGWHCYWKFKEPWIFDSDAEMEQAAVLAMRFNHAHKAHAAAQGWSLDVVGDLSRVLRLPGTYNMKIPGNPRPVTIVESNDRRYNPSDISEYLDQVGVAQIAFTETVAAEQGKLSYFIGATPPLDKLEALLANDAQFKRTYERKRKDFVDQSASSYDMALANVVVQAGWTDQEIVDLLIYSRNKFKDEVNSKLRDSYFIPTIRKARTKFKHEESLKSIETILHTPISANTGEQIASEPIDPLQRKAQLCDALTDALFPAAEDKDQRPLRLVRVTKYLIDPPEYRLVLSHDSIHLGEVSNLVTYHLFRLKVAAAGGRLIPPNLGKPAQWNRVAQALLDCAVDVSVGDDGTDLGLIRGWLSAWFEAQPPVDNPTDANDGQLPFTHQGKIAIYVDEFVRFVHRQFSPHILKKRVSVLLSHIGAVNKSVNYKRASGGNSTRSVWLIDPKVIESAEPAVQVEE